MNIQQKLISISILSIAVFLSVGLKKHVFQLDIQGRHTWRQSQTCLNIRNFTRHDFNILNPRVGHFNYNETNIKRMEFPLMQWLIAGVQRLLGENIRVIRISMMVINLFSCLAAFLLMSFLFSDKILSSISVLVFSFFPVLLYQSINPIPDNLGLCFSLYFILFFFKAIKFDHNLFLWLSAFFLSLAGLCKLPFVLYGVFPLIFLLTARPSKVQIFNMFLAFSLTLIPIILWYSQAIPTWNGNRITTGIFDSDIDLKQYLSFMKAQIFKNIPLIVVGIPQMILLGLSLFQVIKNKLFYHFFAKYVLGGFLIFMLYFLFILKQIREGHDYYFYPFLPLLLIVSMLAFYNFRKTAFANKMILSLLVLLIPVLNWNQISDRWDVDQAFMNEDYFLYRAELREAVPNNEMVIMINDVSNYIVPYVIDKMGYVFMNNHLPIGWIKDLTLNKNIKYMYSDSRMIEEQEGFDECIKERLMVKGSIHVYELH